jgi:prepilin-type N-terminal cleavage/methylation domain-containing protein
VNALIPKDESGVTLVELIVTVAIMGIIMTALAAALIVSFHTTNDTNTSLDQSNAEQFLSLYLTRDVQGADSVATGVTSTCGSEPVALEAKSHSNPLASGSDVTVTYRRSGNNLIRRTCGPVSSTQILAPNITSFTATGANTITINIGTAASANVPAYAWSLEVRRRAA